MLASSLRLTALVLLVGILLAGVEHQVKYSPLLAVGQLLPV
jgi:hypothetical protein